MTGPQPRRRVSVRDAWRGRITRTKTISDSVRVLLLYMATATDSQGRPLMDERGYWRQPQAETAAALGITDRRVRSRLQDARAAGWLALAGGGSNGQVQQYRAQVVGETPAAEQARRTGGVRLEPESRRTLSSRLAPDRGCPPDPAGSPTAQADRGRPPYGARAVPTDTSAGSATTQLTPGQGTPASAAPDQDLTARPRAARQRGVTPLDHHGTGGTGTQPAATAEDPCPWHDTDDQTASADGTTHCAGCARTATARAEDERW